VLYPAEEENSESRSQDRDREAVIRIDYGQTCFLLTGDAERSARMAVVARGEYARCQVLQVGCRGSPEALGAAFPEAVQPAVAIVSCGEDGSVEQGLPDALAQAIDRLEQQGATVLRTDQRGSVEVISDGVRTRVRVER